jgi:hypothetical protein
VALQRSQAAPAGQRHVPLVLLGEAQAVDDARAVALQTKNLGCGI